MNITGTHINYYFHCIRELWLFVNSMNMEHTSDLVYMGKMIHENSYTQRSEKYTELEIDGIKIDFYDHKNKIIHEIKKGDSYELTHQWQIKYYIYILNKNGISGVSGILEYPKLRKTENIILTEKDIKDIIDIEQNIKDIVNNNCPKKKEKKQCKNCSYFDFCWINEE